MSVVRDRQTVQARHIRIVDLRSRTDLPLKAIARAVGLNDHSSVIHHLSGRCGCGALAVSVCQHEYREVCKHCGAVSLAVAVGSERPSGGDRV